MTQTADNTIPDHIRQLLVEAAAALETLTDLDAYGDGSGEYTDDQRVGVDIAGRLRDAAAGATPAIRCYTIDDRGTLHPATPARIVCYDEGDGEWTIEAQDSSGAAIRDAHGGYYSVWHDEESDEDFRPMRREGALSAAVALAFNLGMPGLPVVFAAEPIKD